MVFNRIQHTCNKKQQKKMESNTDKQTINRQNKYVVEIMYYFAYLV